MRIVAIEALLRLRLREKRLREHLRGRSNHHEDQPVLAFEPS
jgi:hypothetical protein